MAYGDDDRPRGGWPDRFEGDPPEDVENWISEDDRKKMLRIQEECEGMMGEIAGLDFESQFAIERINSLYVKAIDAVERLLSHTDDALEEAEYE